VSCLLRESELFGYKAGAFTDAKKDKPGRFALAERGVILLDEIGDTSPAMQVKLLRVIQEKEYEPLGSTKSIKADVRIIVATNQDLYEMVNKATFRKDLYYRLSVINIVIPPLRERREDIPLLIDYYITKLNKQQRKQIRGIDDDAMACLIAHDYPGNVRELENSIERAFVLCNKGYIQKKHLPETACRDNITEWKNTDNKSMRGIEAAFLTNALKRNQWDRRKTALELGIHRTSLYRKMRAFGIYSDENNNET
jgi:transcriptional regulator with PAS, ATPase and Fis domain